MILPAPALRILVIAGLLGAALALGASGASAGVTDRARSAVKAELRGPEARIVRLACRSSSPVRCRWVVARRDGDQTLACRGRGTVRRDGRRPKLGRERCKADRGGSKLNQTLPRKLEKKGLEPIDAFCWGLLGKGFRCEWRAYAYGRQTRECRGEVRVRSGKHRFSARKCDLAQVPSQAQSVLAGQLEARGLRPVRIVCRKSGGWSCEWRAVRESRGWRYWCSGVARAPTVEQLTAGACRLRAPELAPQDKTLPPIELGVNGDWPLYVSEVGRTGKLGADILRMPLSWALVERFPGSYDFRYYDSIYGAMVEAGIAPLFAVSGAPCWATVNLACEGGSGIFPPSRSFDDEWREFFRRLAARYPELAAIEVWNEPNFERYFRGAPRPDRYAELLRHARDGAEAGNPELPLLSGGLAPFTTDAPGEMTDERFLAGVYEASGGELPADAVAYHAYPGGGPDSNQGKAVRRQIADLKQVMLDFGDEDRPIWVTETGITTTGAKNFTPSQQARALRRIYKALARIPGVPVAVVHRWRDQPGRGPEAGYGLIDAAGSQKPAFCAVAKLHRGRC